jgi:hypothetical protein
MRTEQGVESPLWALGDPARLTDTERALLVDPSIDRRPDSPNSR